MNRGYYSRLWVPTLVVALVTILSFAFLSHYQNTQVRLANELNIQTAKVMHDVERVLSGMMRGVLTWQDEYFVEAARISSELEGLILELSVSGVMEQEDLWLTYRELYKSLVMSAALFRENRIPEAELAMGKVRDHAQELRVCLERMRERVALNQARLTQTMSLFMVAAAFLLLGIAVINGLVFIPALVIRPMQQSEERLSTTLQSIGDGVLSTDREGRIVGINFVAEKLCGWKESEVRGRYLEEVFRIVHASTRDVVPDPVKTVLETGKVVGLAKHSMLLSKDGKEYRIADSAAPIHDREGNITGAVLVFRDVTNEYAQAERLRLSEERLDRAMAVKHEGIWEWDLITNETYFDDRYYTMAGYVPSDFPQNFEAWEDLVHPEDLEKTIAKLEAFLAGQIDVFDVEFRFKEKHGTWMWIQGRGKIMERGEDGAPLRMNGTHSDITERKRMEQELTRLATTDSLTGLFNRRIFIETLEKEIGRFHRYGKSAVVMMLDFDHFKRINDTFGHAGGDLVLQSFAGMLKDSVRNTDMAARLGGEEFAVLFPETDLEHARLLAQRILEKVRKSAVSVDGQQIGFTVSIGLGELEADDDCPDRPLSRADKALYKAKDLGRDRLEAA